MANLLKKHVAGDGYDPLAWDLRNNSGTADQEDEIISLSPLDIFWSPDGTKLYLTGFAHKIYEYDCSTPWDASTYALNYTWTVFLNPQGIHLKDDGTKIWFVNATNGYVYQYTLSTPWDLSTNGSQQSYDTGIGSNARALYLSPDGTHLYVTDLSDDTLDQFSLSTAFDITSTSYVRSYDPGISDDTRGIFFKPEGDRMWLVQGRQYDLSTPWDISTATLDNDSTHQMARGFYWKPDGMTMYTMGTGTDEVKQYNMT